MNRAGGRHSISVGARSVTESAITHVREVAKGNEVSELPEEARAWNAAADADGRLSLVK